MTTIKAHQDASKEYAKLSSKIRYLASPDLLHYQSAKTYRSALLRNFNRIKELSQEKRKILEKELNPILTSNHSLSKKEKETLTHYSNTLFNASRMEDVDIPLFYRITNRLLIDADKKGNTKDIIHALDRYIEACFAMMHMSSRFDFCDPTCYNYRDYGLNAAYRLLSYLPQKKFASLPDDETKEIVLVNSRYICSLFLCSDSYGNEKINTQDFEQLKNSLALTNKSFYKKHAPNYNWEYHEFRCYEYINGLTEENNIRQFNDEQLEEIYRYTLAMEEMWNKNEEFFSAICPKGILNLYLSRISFLTHRLTVEQYRHQLDTIIGSDTKGKLSYHEDILNILVLSEYLYVIHLQPLTEKDKRILNRYYKDIIHYLFSVPKTGSFTLTISFLTLFLYKYVDIHKKDEFLDLLLTVISAFHPPTYVHSLTMASINRSLTKHLLKNHPELYIGFNNYKNIDEVKKHKKDILDFAYRSALCHDIGKIYVLEFIMTYGRSLYKEEFSLIMKHPEVGAYILSQHEETKAYQNIAKYHHRYFNETSGYPEESYRDLEEAIFIDTACVADCIDAATDSIGRSYKTAKNFKEIVSEMKDYSGTRYAPYVVDLFNDPITYQEIESILNHERNENYAKVYDIVKKNIQSEE